jgi:hypothetical protein
MITIFCEKIGVFSKTNVFNIFVKTSRSLGKKPIFAAIFGEKKLKIKTWS